MSSKDKSFRDKETSLKTLSQLLRLNLVDETAEMLLNEEDLSFEHLSKHHTLTEIGTALIRLDALHSTPAEENCECYWVILGHKICYPCTQKPPDED